MGQHARERPDDRAVVEVGEGGVLCEWSFAELHEAAGRWAGLLRELGVGPGEPVAYQLPNLLEFVAISLAIVGLGAVCEPLMPIFRERELEFMLSASDTRVLIVPREFRRHDHAAMAHGLQPAVASLEHVVVLDEVELPAPASETSGPSAEMSAQLLFTSGSTGEPKGVLQTHASLNLAARTHIRHFRLTRDDVIYIPSPLAHQTGFLYGMWIALMLGAPQVVQTAWDAEAGFDAMQSTGVTFVQAATPFLADLVRVTTERGTPPAALNTFVATGTAIPRELARTARAALGADVGGAFGTTESCLGAAFVPGEDPDRAWSTDGRALEGITLRITDDDGNPLPPGEEGNFEVLTRTLFEGYLNRPELTAEALTADGYYRTGDLARIDAEGYLKITGRVKDVINRGGEKVPVAEVEQVLYAHPAIKEVAIVAMPDARLGERACAFVVLQDGGELDFDKMQQHLDAQRVAKPYWPERLELVDALPYTPSGKIQKFVLRDRLAAESQRKAVPPMTTAPLINADPTPVDEAEFAALKAEIRAYVDNEGERWTELIEAERQVPTALWDELRERGYLKLAAPQSLGGRGLPFARYLELIELFSRPHASLRMIVHVMNGLWRAMLPFANEEQVERFVRTQVATEIRVAFTLTEPNAGTGADIKCSVAREGDTYYLSGQKHLITFGCISDYLLLFARLEGTHGADGTVALMVPAHGEGIQNDPMPESMGVLGTDHAHLIFDRAPVPVANRLGEEGEGLDVALGGFLVPSRISVAMTCVGLAGRALDLAVEHSKKRETFGKPIASRQAIAFRLAEMAADLEAARQLTLHAARTWEETHDAAAESSMAKLFASEMLQRVTDGGLQVFGGIGYFRSPIERVYRDARAQRFEEGTVEVQKQTIARALLA